MIPEKEECGTYKHVNCHLSVDMIHIHIAFVYLDQHGSKPKREENLQFIKTTDWRSHSFPERQQQTDL